MGNTSYYLHIATQIQLNLNWYDAMTFYLFLGYMNISSCAQNPLLEILLVYTKKCKNSTKELVIQKKRKYSSLPIRK